MRPLRCQGCGREVPLDAADPFRCPAAGDGGDHVLGRAPGEGREERAFPLEGDENPFVRFRALSSAHALALARGLSDDGFVALVRALDAAVARADGGGFAITPFGRSAALSDTLGLRAPGGVFVKDETGNVSGSHKARHLFGLALFGEVRRRAGLAADAGARLAIASCGNAALAAAVVARAWGRALDVFIPPDANPRVVERLHALGAGVHVCARRPGVAGDPCHHAFRRAVEEGALPFCCQGSDNGLTIEGGETLAYELVAALRRERRTLDRLLVQVGGGALASACVQGFARASEPLPRFHPVQTRGAFPLRRAWERLAARLAARFSLAGQGTDATLASALRARIAAPAGVAVLDEELRAAAANRARYMWAWETEPKSVAHGILDDETWDWLAILRGTLESGGWPVVASEERLREAHARGREAGFRADATGTAGLAGLIELRAAGAVADGEASAVLFTGVER